ncbi:MAG: mechanosensitive ion channel domain-containing protein [Mycobacteriales bacterium]
MKALIVAGAARSAFGVRLTDVWLETARIVGVLLVSVIVLGFARHAIPRAISRITNATRGDERTELRARTLSALLITVVTVAIWIFVVLTVLGAFDINIAPLLAGAGVAGLAIGFGAQQLVRDVISGFFILAEDQFGVGDTITTAGVTGTVETVSLRITRIRGDDGVLHHVRNGDMGVVSNSTRGWATVTIDIPLDPAADTHRAQDVLIEAMALLASSGQLDGKLLAAPDVLGITELRPDATIMRITARTEPSAKSVVLRAMLTASRSALAGGSIGLAPRPPVPAA